jgi:GrpB-like predicted nucleotidyltransferase (UPF0157 family)
VNLSSSNAARAYNPTTNPFLQHPKKRELASRNWAYIQNYADAKTDVIEEIIARAEARAVDL